MNRSIANSQRSQNDTREIGTCEVCDNDRVGVIRSTGRLRKHGPRSAPCSAPCSGYNSLPVVGSVRLRDDNAPGTSAQDDMEDADDADSVSSISAGSNHGSPGADDSGSVTHPPLPATPILKRIPKGARSAAANLLQVLITKVLEDRTSSFAWSRLFGFASSCFATPPRGGRSRNLTTLINRQIDAYSSEINVARCPSSQPEALSCSRQLRSRAAAGETSEKPEAIAKRASIKLEDGDVRGAIRILSSSDTTLHWAPFTPQRRPTDALRPQLRLHPFMSQRL